MIRFRLGLFDPVAMVKYAQTPVNVLESAEHQKHALDMAHESMVLLRNNNLLPLSKSLKKIVVLGPNADNAVSILGNYNGTPSKLSTVLQGIKDKVGANTEVVYEKATTFTSDQLLNYSQSLGEFSYDNQNGFKAEYFNNKELEGKPVATRIEKNPSHYWQEGETVINNLTASDFSARYTSNFKASDNNTLSLELEADNGCKLIINGKTVVNSWTPKKQELKRYKLEVKKDSVYKIAIEYWQADGNATLKFNVGNYVKTDFAQLAAKHKDADAFIFVGGISPELEGESMKVDDPGFNGGDRTSILLPEVQTNLMKALKSTGKPVVFVMMTGSAIATPWESENIPAILNAWYGGQATGEAVADILFGDYNPSGRLPVTFYKGDSDIPDFTDYSMKERTYRYFTGKPLYGFGYGLSYSTFKYQDLKTEKPSKNGDIKVTAKLTNTSKIAGDEVVQLYVTNKNKDITTTSLKSLKGFKRITLKPGESKLIKFTLTTDDLSYVDAAGKTLPLKGNVQISIGGSQPDEVNITRGNIVKTVLSLK